MPARRPVKPRRAARSGGPEETVRAVIGAACQVLARGGWAALSTNKVAARAGVSIGSVYHYFPNREALLQAVTHHIWREEELAVAEALQREPSPEDLRAVIGRAVGALLAHVDAHRALYAEWYWDSPHHGDADFRAGQNARASQMLFPRVSQYLSPVPENLAFTLELVVAMATSLARRAPRTAPGSLSDGSLQGAIVTMGLALLAGRAPAR